MIDVKTFFQAVEPHLNEKTRRIVAAALTLGNAPGIKGTVSRDTGVSHHAIKRGLEELQEGALKAAGSGGVRHQGGGRQKTQIKYPEILESLKSLVDGDPESPLLWTCKSLRVISDELKNHGYKVSYPTVGSMLEELGYNLQGNRKALERLNNTDINAQFIFLNRRILAFARMEQPIISIDCKKQVLDGNFKNIDKEYHIKGEPTKANDHDFLDKNLGKTIPFGIYDISKKNRLVNVSINHENSIFVVQSIRSWWEKMGYKQYTSAKRLLIAADCGGSNSYGQRLWRYELSKFAQESGLIISVCNFPVVTSKWNKIEHRFFSQITMNWRERPLISLEVVVNLINATKTVSSLKENCQLDKEQQGLKVDDEELAEVKIKPSHFHGDWNYTLYP